MQVQFALLEMQMGLVILKYLQNLHEKQNYNWCAYLKCMNDVVIEWKGDEKFFFRGHYCF